MRAFCTHLIASIVPSYGHFMCVFTRFTLVFTFFLYWALLMYLGNIGHNRCIWDVPCIIGNMHEARDLVLLILVLKWDIWCVPSSDSPEWYSMFGRMEVVYSLSNAMKAFARIRPVFGWIRGHSTACSHIQSNESYTITSMDFGKINCWGRIYWIWLSKGDSIRDSTEWHLYSIEWVLMLFTWITYAT